MEAKYSNAVSLLNNLAEKAVELNASDIHIEPRKEKIDIRYRVDGLLNDGGSIPKNIHQQLISRIKVISNLDISEQRLPQDGRTFIRSSDREFDLRISTIPTFWGEKAVIRILDRNNMALPIEELGMGRDQLKIYNEEIKRAQGLLLVSGPTGSGKTTTLYASLSRINSNEKNITTIEDPIEYQLSGINQVQVNEKSGLTFARGLRSVLRQDPDIIMVGEIRDMETAEIAVRAAMTGHLVFSTLHTNSAVESINRLVDIGIEPYLLSSINCIIAQRLVRKWDPINNRYQGRTAVFEVLRIDGNLRDAIHERARNSILLKLARASGFRTMLEISEGLIKDGTTTREEVIRVLSGE